MSARAVAVLGVLGGGVIGAGWAARARHFGLEVVVADVAEAAEARVREELAAAEPGLAALFGPPAPGGSVAVVSDPRALAERADFIQECLPEDLALKRAALALLVAAAPADVVIASSTSNLTPSMLQQGAAQEAAQEAAQIAAQEEARPQSPARAERLLVGHPFHPVALMPILELVAGARTAPWAMAAAEAFYTRLQFRPLRLRREVFGHIGNRLQEAVWREALHMIAAGEASAEDIDQAMTDGPGLRWAFMGPILTYHLAGGAGGMARTLAHFGDAAEQPLARAPGPPLDDALAARLKSGAEQLAHGRDWTRLRTERDAKLAAVLRALQEVAPRDGNAAEVSPKDVSPEDVSTADVPRSVIPAAGVSRGEDGD